MQRGTYVISLSAQAAEGALVVRGEPQPAFSQTLHVPGDDPVAAAGPPGLAGAFLEQAEWQPGLTTLVLPTSAVSVRRLHFDFSDPRKIRQVLPLEIQNELLEPLDQYAYDALVRPDAESGGSEALVILAPKSELEPLIEVMERHQLIVHRVTFAAQALAECVPVTSSSHFCVYLGYDESNVAHLQDGRLHGFQALTAHPGAELETQRAKGPGSPLEHLRALIRAADDDEALGPVRERLHEALAAAVSEANRFLRIHGAGAPFTVSMHGFFAHACHWHEERGELELRLPTGDWPQAQRTHFGLLETVLGQPRSLVSPRGVNLRRRVGTWLAAIRDLRWPLAAAGVLVAVLTAILLTGFQMRANALEARLEGLEQQLQRSLGMRSVVTTATVTDALNRMQAEVERTRRDREAVAYLERYHYNVLRLLRDLSEVVHAFPSLTVESLSVSRDRMTLSGLTPSYADSENLKNRIAALPRFEGQTVKVTNASAGQVIRYRLTAER